MEMISQPVMVCGCWENVERPDKRHQIGDHHCWVTIEFTSVGNAVNEVELRDGAFASRAWERIDDPGERGGVSPLVACRRRCS